MMRAVRKHTTCKWILLYSERWLKAPVLREDGTLEQRNAGTPQGGVASPLLANIYLHYVFDIWADRWRRKHARGDMIIVRFADDFVVGFQYKGDATAFQRDLTGRFGKFNLELHAEKSRLIEFGRFAAQNRKGRGEGKPDTFDFLGFTHICGTTSKGKFTVHRRTIRKRIRAKLGTLKIELRKRLHLPVPVVGKWLRVVLLGHFRYYGLPGNSDKLEAFKYHVSILWYRTLKRRSQRHRLNWERMDRLIARWLPNPRIMHPYPDLGMYVITRGRSPVR